MSFTAIYDFIRVCNDRGETHISRYPQSKRLIFDLVKILSAYFDLYHCYGSILLYLYIVGHILRGSKWRNISVFNGTALAVLLAGSGLGGGINKRRRDMGQTVRRGQRIVAEDV